MFVNIIYNFIHLYRAGLAIYIIVLGGAIYIIIYKHTACALYDMDVQCNIGVD